MVEEKPPSTRYRLNEGYPDKLNYKNGCVLISFRADDDHSWYLFAAKESDPTNTIEIMRGPSMLEWSNARFEGFDVLTGSPADRIMQKLVREGGAVVMASDETFRLKREKRERRR